MADNKILESVLKIPEVTLIFEETILFDVKFVVNKLLIVLPDAINVPEISSVEFGVVVFIPTFPPVVKILPRVFVFPLAIILPFEILKL